MDFPLYVPSPGFRKVQNRDFLFDDDDNDYYDYDDYDDDYYDDDDDDVDDNTDDDDDVDDDNNNDHMICFVVLSAHLKRLSGFMYV